MVLVGLAGDAHLEALVRVNGGSPGELVGQLHRSRAMLYSHMSLGYPLTNLVCLGSNVPGLGPGVLPVQCLVMHALQPS